MDDWKLPWAGGCRCDRVRIEVTKPPMLAGACHCSGCRKMTASAFSLTLTIPSDGFAVTAGELPNRGIGILEMRDPEVAGHRVERLRLERQRSSIGLAELDRGIAGARRRDHRGRQVDADDVRAERRGARRP